MTVTVRFILQAMCLFTLLTATVVYSADAQEANFPVVKAVKMLPMSELHNQRCHSLQLDDSTWPVGKISDIKQQQHLCLRAWIHLDEFKATSPIVLTSLLAAYDLYWDGSLLIQSGKVGSQYATEEIGPFRNNVSLDRTMITPGKHLLSIELSTFKVPPDITNIAYVIMTIDLEELDSAIHIISSTTSILIGVLITLAVLCFSLYCFYSRQLPLLLFSLLCLVSGALLIAEQWKIWFAYYYDMHLFRLRLILLITLVLSLLLPSYYLAQNQFKHKGLWLLSVLIGAAGIVFGVDNYDDRSHWLFVLGLSVSFVISGIALKNKQAYTLSATIILALSIAMLAASPFYFLEFGFGLVIILIVISIWVALIHQLKQQKENALKAAVVKAELLRRNLQPHFLMNCLTQVQELIDTSPDHANHFVAELADEFRTLVQMSESSTVPLSHEIALCQKHLNIMSVRYQQQFELQVSGNIADITVPSAIVHSQIENCFTHNRISKNQEFMLQVQTHNHWVTLTLSTPIETSINHDGLGVGEAYILSKLAEVCKEDWRFHSQESNRYWVSTYHYKIQNGNP